jgi:hypothetical protein
MSSENVSFCSPNRLPLRGNPLDFRAAARLRPLPLRFWIRFCAEKLKCFAIMWRGLTSLDVLSAKTDRILPPVSSITRLTGLTPLQSTGRINRNRQLKDCLVHVHVARRVRPNTSGSPRYVTRDPPEGGSTVQVDPSL